MDFILTFSPGVGDSIFLDGDLPAPYFDLNHSSNVTAVLGKTALLNCRVKNIGNRTVSSAWALIKHCIRDLLANKGSKHLPRQKIPQAIS